MTVSKKFEPDYLIAAALCLGALLFWWLRIVASADVSADVLRWTGGDLYTQVYPMWHRALAWLRDGQIPLWNPFQHCGVPFLATLQYGMLYPLNVFFVLLPRTEVAIEYTAVLHVFAAGLFMYLYGRVIRLSRAAAAVAAITFMFSGFLASQAIYFTSTICAAAWLPLGFVAVEKIFAERRWRWAVLLAVAVAMPLLAGFPQTWLYAMYGIGSYAGVELLRVAWHRDERRQLPRVCGLLAGGVALGVCLTAIQLLPSLELQRLGPRRPGGLSQVQISPFGAIPPSKFLAEAIGSRPGFPRLAYLGMSALILAPLALLARSGRWRVGFLWCLLLLSAGVALPVYTPLFALYRMLPASGWFRTPYRILYLYTFAGAVLSGIGFDIIASQESGARGRRAWITVGLAGLVAAAWLWLAVMPLRSHAYIVIGAIGVAGACMLPRAMRRLPLAGLVALVVVDLFRANQNPDKHPYHDLAVLDAEHEVFDFIKAHQGFDRTYINSGKMFVDYPTMAKQGTLRGIYSVTDYETLTVGRYDKFYPLLEGANAPDYNLWTFTGSLNLDPSPQRLKLFDMMSVRFTAAGTRALPLRAGLEQAGWRAVFTPQAGNLVVYENPDPLPRAYVATQARLVGSEEDALAAVTAPGFDPRTVVILESNDSQRLPPNPEPGQAIEPARITEYAPARVVIDANAAGPAHLVLTDTYYPGWQATVDGQPAAICRANYLFRAVAIPPGRHTLTFTYAPLSFTLGAGITLATLGGLAGAAAIGARRACRGWSEARLTRRLFNGSLTCR